MKKIREIIGNGEILRGSGLKKCLTHRNPKDHQFFVTGAHIEYAQEHVDDVEAHELKVHLLDSGEKGNLLVLTYTRYNGDTLGMLFNTLKENDFRVHVSERDSTVEGFSCLDVFFSHLDCEWVFVPPGVLDVATYIALRSA